VLTAVDEADLIIFVVDGRVGLTSLDEEIATILRKSRAPVLVAVNKVDSVGQESGAVAEYYRLGFSPIVSMSAEHGRGVAELLEAARECVPAELPETASEGTRVAIIGRPNVGKSSLVNAVLGNERVLVHDQPGTTRDAVDTPVSFRGKDYLLIDTAGIRRKGKVSEALEKLAVVMALKSLERCQVAVLVMDASDGVTAQDAHIAGYAAEAGRAMVVAVNKWDLVPPGLVQKSDVVGQIYDRLPFLEYAPVCFISAVNHHGLGELFDQIDRTAAEAQKRIPPSEVLTVLRQAVERRPLSSRGVALWLHSAQQVGVLPPTFALRVNLQGEIHFSYQRYLVNSIRHTFGFAGSPIRLLFRKVAKKPRTARAARRASR
jgi:GTP-binding protein